MLKKKRRPAQTQDAQVAMETGSVASNHTEEDLGDPLLEQNLAADQDARSAYKHPLKPTPRTAPSTAAKATGNIDSSPPTTPRFSSLTSPRQHAENLKSQAEAVARGAAVAATTGPVFQPREWTLLGFADIHHVDQDLALRVSANGSPTMHRIAVALTDPGVMDAYALSFVQASCLGQLVEKWREHRGEETAESKLSARRRLAHYMRDVMVMDMDEARRPQSLS